MVSGLRSIDLVEHGIDVTQPPVASADHVVGVDESGNDDQGPFVMVAVQSPRSFSEGLAEILIEQGLEPWKSKSSSLPRGMDYDDLSNAVSDLMSLLASTPVTWHAVAGWGAYGVDQRAAIACIVASKAMTGGSGSLPEFDGPAAFIHDGGDRLYGNRQELLRRAATRQFNGFADRITPIYLTQLETGDKTYPEITAADYIAGYLREQINQHGIEGTPYDIQRIDQSWSVSDDPPTTLYSLRARDRRQSPLSHDRAAAWIEGRQPAPGDAWGGQPFDSLVNRLQSDIVKNYLLNEL